MTSEFIDPIVYRHRNSIIMRVSDGSAGYPEPVRHYLNITFSKPQELEINASTLGTLMN